MYLLPYGVKYLVTTMQNLVMATWGNIGHYIEYGYDSSGPSYGRISMNGYTNVDIAWRIMCGIINDKSCISHGQ